MPVLYEVPTISLTLCSPDAVRELDVRECAYLSWNRLRHCVRQLTEPPADSQKEGLFCEAVGKIFSDNIQGVSVDGKSLWQSDPDGVIRAVVSYLQWIEELKMKFSIPCYPDEKEQKSHYAMETLPEKYVADYARMSLEDALHLRVSVYAALLRDAVIYSHMQTEAGRDYLEKCWYLEQTEPDRAALREKFGKKG